VIRTTTSSPSSSSSVICGSSRAGVVTAGLNSSWMSVGVTPGRRRARVDTGRSAQGGMTATLSTTLLGTMIESSPLAKSVQSSPSELTTP